MEVGGKRQMELELVDLTRVYKNKIAVNKVNYMMKPGIYGLLGANGAGKTTLMRLICDVLNISSGEILLDGKPISALGEKYRELLGYLPQNFGYYPDFTAEEFMHYMATLKGLKASFAKKKTKQLLEELNLSDVAKKKIKTFSGGMRQRLGIAQAMLNDPKILVLDEPTAGLDPKERVRFRRLIAGLAKGRIVILSTHIVSDVEDIADTILMMKNGKFVLTGTVDEITDEMAGKVWEITLRETQLAWAERKYNIANIHQHDGFVEIRVVSDKKPDKDAKPIKPRLEDLYLSYFESNEYGD